jgi:glycine cleavage system H protein
VGAGSEAAVVESVKAASEVYAPATGEVIEANDAIQNEPAKVNADPEGEGWFFRMRVTDPAAVQKLMSKDQYTEYVKGL